MTLVSVACRYQINGVVPCGSFDGGRETRCYRAEAARKPRSPGSRLGAEGKAAVAETISLCLAHSLQYVLPPFKSSTSKQRPGKTDITQHPGQIIHMLAGHSISLFKSYLRMYDTPKLFWQQHCRSGLQSARINKVNFKQPISQAILELSH